MIEVALLWLNLF